MTEVYQTYLAALCLVTAWAVWRGTLSQRIELARAGMVVLGHGLVMQLAALVFPPIAGQGYPFLLVAVTLVLALRLVCLDPATRGNAVLAGSILSGIIASLIYGVHVLINGPSVHADWNYWLSLFTMGVVNLIILLGWTHELRIRRLAGRCVSTVIGMVRSAYIGGLAR